MPITLQFVDKIDAAPTTRLDLNDGTKWLFQRKPLPDLSPPPLKRAVVSTLMRQGAKIVASAYDNRVLKFDLVAQAATEDLLATELQKLNRELDRANNILKYQPIGATNPVYFRTFRSPGYSLNVESEPVFRVRLGLELLAEPFAYGERVTLNSVTVNNDPAAGSNPCYWDVTGVTGDVPTPAFLKFAASPSVANQRMALGVRRHGTPGGVYPLQAEGMTLGTDTTLPGNDAAMSGAGSNYARTSFATATMQTRLTAANFPVTAAGQSVEYRGTYRIFARVRHSVAGDTIRIKMTYGPTGIATEPVTLPNQTWLMWVDLGLVRLPASVDDPVSGEGYSNVPNAARIMSLNFQAERVSGSGNLDWDVVLAVPADEELAIIAWPTSTSDAIIDGPNDSVYSRLASASDSLYTTAPIPRAGSIPLLSPNQTNRIALLVNVGGDLQADDLADSAAVVLSYWPRHLYVKP